MAILLFLIAAFGNIWIWKIASYSWPLAIFLIISAVSISVFVFRKNKVSLLMFVLGIVVSVLIGGVSRPNLLANSQDKLLIRERLNEYPPITWAPVAHWLEERKETVALYKIADNIGLVVSPNLYFFADHPREQVGLTEIEKYPYIFLPVFLFGLALLLSTERTVFFAASFMLPVVYLMIFSSNPVIGPYILFPFFTVSITQGLMKLNKKLLVLFLIILIPVFIQSIIYAKN